jgi:hypothetical protein
MDGMNPYIRIERLFHEALAIAPGDREEWLRGRCADDQGLLEEISSLLDAHAAMASAAGVSCPAGEGAVPEDRPVPSGRFGVWKPVRPLGHGGMSSVYLAERADGQFKQYGALKVMAGHLIDPEFLRPFETERQLLAALGKPSTATAMSEDWASKPGCEFSNRYATPWSTPIAT